MSRAAKLPLMLVLLMAAGGAGTAGAHIVAPPPGATAICRDGTYSFSQHHSGTCSHHGGVRRWLHGSRTIPPQWQNCAAVHKRYPHGVGKADAHDKTSGVPVTNFTHSTKLYERAMRYNSSLDRDHDGIACEKH